MKYILQSLSPESENPRREVDPGLRAALSSEYSTSSDEMKYDMPERQMSRIFDEYRVQIDKALAPFCADIAIRRQYDIK